ncbi:helix-turn-helix transcriptional regulator [Kibdelosporangium lantanae]
MDNRRELAEFLRSRRERITPAEVGLPTDAGRRTPGLRRQEVAVLAGMSPSWYTFMEQGRGIRPSPAVLDNLARALRMTEDERRYLFRLANAPTEAPTALVADITTDDLLKQLVSTHADSPYPVYAADSRGDILAWNDAAAEWYDDWSPVPVEQRNIVRWIVTSPVAKHRLVRWADEVRDMAARFRAEAAAHPDDREIRARMLEVAGLNPEFAAAWDAQDVVEHRSRLRYFRHDRLGEQALRLVVMGCAELVSAGVVIHLPVGTNG